MTEQVAVLAVFLFLYSVVAGRLERTPFGGPILYTAVGLGLGSFGLDIPAFEVEGETIGTLARLTLALVLFTDAAGLNLRFFLEDVRVPQRLLGIGLPLTIALGVGVGAVLFDDLSWFEIAILATMLAPTDAALGKAVVSNSDVPERVRMDSTWRAA